jgi:hypothetical protein
MNKEVENELKKSRVGFVHFVDISKLTKEKRRGNYYYITLSKALVSPYSNNK